MERFIGVIIAIVVIGAFVAPPYKYTAEQQICLKQKSSMWDFVFWPKRAYENWKGCGNVRYCEKVRRAALTDACPFASTHFTPAPDISPSEAAEIINAHESLDNTMKAANDRYIAAEETCLRDDAADPKAMVAACTIAIERGPGDIIMAGYDLDELPLLYARRGDAQLARGVELGDDEILKLAIADYSGAIDAAPDDSTFYLKRGDAYLMLTEEDGLQKAYEDYSSAIKVDPNNPAGYRARLRLIAAPETLAQFEIMVFDLGELIRLEPQNDVLYLNLAALHAMAPETNLEFEYVDRAIAIEAKPVSYTLRASFRLAAGDADAALSDIDQALKLDPTFSAAYTGRGMTKTASGDFGGAIDDFSQAIEFNSEDPWPVLFRAGAYLHSGRDNAALSDLYDALARDPNLSLRTEYNQYRTLAYDWRALAFLRLGRRVEAQADCDKIPNLNQPLAICAKDGGGLAAQPPENYFEEFFRLVRENFSQNIILPAAW